jgi:hypothetical protein
VRYRTARNLPREKESTTHDEGGFMTTFNRTVIWSFAVLGVALLLMSLLGSFAMGGGTAGGGMMGGGGMVGMYVTSLLWLMLTIIVIGALVTLVVHGEVKN